MAGWVGRLMVAVVAGVGLAASVGMLHHGVGQGALGLVQEPVAGFAPFRWPALPADRSARVLLLGTSLTRNGTWAEVLEARLSACRAGGVTVERLAKPGANSAWGQGALRDRLAQEPVPDLIVVEFTVNDASLFHGMTLGKSRDRHVEILQAAEAAGSAVWLATMSIGTQSWL